MKLKRVLVALGILIIGSTQAAEGNRNAEQAARERYVEMQDRLSDRMASMLAERLNEASCAPGQVAPSAADESRACSRDGQDQLLAAD